MHSRRCHPDRSALNDASSAWEQAQREGKEHGRGRQRSTASDRTDGVMVSLREQAKTKKEFHLQSAAVRLTYQKSQEKDVWEDFVAFLRENLHHWKAKLWRTTMETNTDLTYYLQL